LKISPVRRRQIHKLLAGIAADPGRRAVIAAIHKAGKPVYASAPSDPGRVVQVLPNGRRTIGRLVGRRFVPARAAAPGSD